MECGKLTAKLRDAVPVCFIVDGKEVKRYKNIEIPDEVKHLPFIDFRFDVPQSGVITFKIMFEAGVLPDVWPEARQRKQRNSKSPKSELTDTTETHDDSISESVAYNIIGERRKALVAAIANYTGDRAIYQNAPTFAYQIGLFAVDKNGTLTGPIDHSLIQWLASEGFRA